MKNSFLENLNQGVLGLKPYEPGLPLEHTQKKFGKFNEENWKWESTGLYLNGWSETATQKRNLLKTENTVQDPFHLATRR